MAQIGQVKQYNDDNGTFPFIITDVDEAPLLDGRVIVAGGQDFDANAVKHVTEATQGQPSWQDIPFDL